MKGIIFTESNFLLTIQGVKKQTRRIIKPQPEENLALAEEGNYDNCDVSYTNKFTKADWIDDSCNFFRPRYKVGETVYLKEPYIITGQTYEYEYLHENKTDIACIKRNGGYKNKLFMPKIAARYFIKVTGVKAERLQDISEEDCIKEGIKIGRCGNESKWMKAFYAPDDNQPYITAKSAYEEVFNRINGKVAWQMNPFVWVYDYDLTKQF